MGLLDTITDLLEGDVPPANRLDVAVRALERYYSSIGNESTILPYYDTSLQTKILELIPSIGPSDGESDNEDLSIYAQRFIRSLIQDTSEGAYFAKDILYRLQNDLKVCGITSEKILNTIAVKFESWAYPESPGNSTVRQNESIGVLDQTTVWRRPQSGGTQGTTDPVSPIGNQDGDPDRISNPFLSGILINDVRLSPANRRSAAASIFFNSIPTIEMSQLAPFLKMTFVTDMPDIVSGGHKLSLVGFLGEKDSGSLFAFPSLGYSESTYPDPDFLPVGIDPDEGFDIPPNRSLTISTNSIIPGSGDVDLERKLRAAGTEIFTSPQTMNNIGESSSISPIINPTAPLASLQRLTVDQVGLREGILSNKTGNIEFTLHDRSRMQVIAPLIGAGSWGATYIVVEYGWTHPQATGANVGNVYADFLNSIRDRAIFNIQAADLSMLDDGQVRVTLKLASRPMLDMTSLPVGTGIDHVSAKLVEKFLRRILGAIDKAKTGQVEAELQEPETSDDELIRAALQTELTDIQAEFPVNARRIRGTQALIPLLRYQGLLEGLRSNGSAIVAQDSLTLVQDILSEIENNNSSQNRWMTLAEGIREKQRAVKEVDIFNDGESTSDVTQQSQEMVQNQGVQEVAPETETSSANLGSYDMPTLGSVLMTFVGTTLQSTLKYDEVQFLFYQFNNHAAAKRNTNIAEFRLVGFNRFIEEFIQKKPSASINTFMSELFKDNCGPSKMNHPEYGMADIYAQFNTADLALTRDLSSSERAEILQTRRDLEQGVLREIYGSSSDAIEKFEVPDVTVMMECLPARGINAQGEFWTTPDKVIMRVHVFDSKASIPFEADVLNSMLRSDDLTMVVQAQGERDSSTASGARNRNITESTRSTKLGSAIERFISEHKIRTTKTEIDGTEIITYISNADPREVKDAIKSVCPSITFGGQFTNVHKISMSSNTSGDVAQTLFMTAVSDRNPVLGPSQDPNQLDDLFVIPTNATLTTAGFPLVSYGQRFYIDMGTGTTADNFYYVVGIRHTLTPGNLQSSFTTSYSGNATLRSIKSAMQTVAESTES